MMLGAVFGGGTEADVAILTRLVELLELLVA